MTYARLLGWTVNIYQEGGVVKAQWNQSEHCLKGVFKGTGNHNSCTVSQSAPLRKKPKSWSRAGVPGAPSRLVGGGVCLYDAVVFCGDPGPGLRQFRLLQFAFLVRENLPAAEEERHAK